jgi:hypothetical protein
MSKRELSLSEKEARWKQATAHWDHNQYLPSGPRMTPLPRTYNGVVQPPRVPPPSGLPFVNYRGVQQDPPVRITSHFSERIGREIALRREARASSGMGLYDSQVERTSNASLEQTKQYPPKLLEDGAVQTAIEQSLIEEQNANDLRRAKEESIKDEHARQTRIVGDIRILDARLPQTNITFKQLGGFLMPFRQTGDPHSTFASMTESARALRALHDSCGLNKLVHPNRAFAKLTYGYVLGNASGVNAHLLNNRKYLQECCEKLTESIGVYIADGDFVAQGQSFGRRNVLSDVIIFIWKIMPDNFPNKQQSMEILFQEILQDSATANTDGIMTLDTPKIANWSCGEGMFDRLLIQLGVSINKYTDNKPYMTVDNFNALPQDFFNERFQFLMEHKPADYLTRPIERDVLYQIVLNDLIANIIELLIHDNILDPQSSNYGDMVRAITEKSNAYLLEMLDIFVEMANGISKRKRKLTRGKGKLTKGKRRGKGKLTKRINGVRFVR